MRASRHAESALALALALATPASTARAQEADVRAHLAERRYDEALAATAGIDDAELRAEWRFHLLTLGGDLPGALRAAREGLELGAENPRLLENAVRTALALGLGEEAAALSARLGKVEGLDAATAERAASLVPAVAELKRLEREGERGVARARRAAAALLGTALAALLALALVPIRRVEERAPVERR